jgi:hypothetical protein
METSNTEVIEGKPGRKRPLVKPKCSQVVNNKEDLGEIGCGGMDSLGLPWDRYSWRALI